MQQLKTKEIPLTKGKVALIDEADFALVSQYKWHVNKSASGHYYAKAEQHSRKSMHRFILGITDPKVLVDHINGNGLDNRRENLRICTKLGNRTNSNKSKNNETGFKGVKIDKSCTKTPTFIATITHKKKCIHLGSFKDPTDAAKAYDIKAIELFGDFAKTNKMLGLLSI